MKAYYSIPFSAFSSSSKSIKMNNPWSRINNYPLTCENKYPEFNNM